MTPSQLADIREKEQREAGKILGVKNFVFMGYPDGYLVHTLELRRDLARVVRAYRPEVVICFDPTNRFFSDNYVNHPDHRASGDATIDAVFPSARDRLTFPELSDPPRVPGHDSSAEHPPGCLSTRFADTLPVVPGALTIRALRRIRINLNSVRAIPAR
jgi:LmbE family N-acetylglucosaminyl deacetylase